MDFDDLQALLWVHQHGSLQSAARATGVSRTTLRRRLDHLEGVVGRRVYVSDPGGIVLTAAGETLVEEGAALLVARDRLVERVRGPSVRDTLRVLIQTGLPPAVVALGTSLFGSLLPEVRMVIDLDADPASRVGEAFDAVLHWGDAPVVSTGYTRSLLRVTFGVMGAPAYLAAHGTPQTPADLADHRLLHLKGTEPRWRCRSGTVVEFTPAHACADLYLLGLLAGRGLGLALVPVAGPMVEGPLGLLGAGEHPLVHPSIDGLQRVLADQIELERCLRVDMPQPSQDDSAAATVIQVASRFGQALEPIGPR